MSLSVAAAPPTTLHERVQRVRRWVDDNLFRSEGRDYADEMTVTQQHRLVGMGAAAGASVGGIVGGVAGFIVGQAQSARNVTITRTYPIPDMYSKHLGQIPASFNQYDWGWGSGWFPPSPPPDGSHGWEQVYRNAPHLDAQGHPVMVDHTQTLSSR